MILEAGGHASWWARAAIYATHIHNRLFSTYTPNATSYELIGDASPICLIYAYLAPFAIR